MVLVDFLFPRKCVGCGRRGNYFCEECLNKLCLIKNNICPVCGEGSIDGRAHPRCRGRYCLDGLTSIFEFKGMIAGTISKLKYRFVSDVAEDLIEGFLSFLGEAKAFSDFVLKEKPILVPMPLFKGRKKWRGFNQAELLGKMVVENLGVEYDDSLVLRIRQTKPQAMLRKKERMKNVRGVFKINKKGEIKRKIILFDDVWTSGATMRECGRILKRRGARTVWGLTVARGA